jgi:hypothetical protein
LGKKQKHHGIFILQKEEDLQDTGLQPARKKALTKDVTLFLLPERCLTKSLANQPLTGKLDNVLDATNSICFF